jgi:formylglycine-generating enzyme
LGRALGLAVVVCGLMGMAEVAAADVFNMGGYRDPLTGHWTGTASLETVSVGNPDNAADATDGSSFYNGIQHYGQVNYDYKIGKYEVTAGQYTAFLNAVAGVDTYCLYNTNMWTDLQGCKIERYTGNGTLVSPYQYQVAADYANRPVNYVSFWDACRFANWLNNGQGGEGTTEDGAYSLASGITITRNTGATWAVTSNDEWYKAAYYDPATSNYYFYPTGSNTIPGHDMMDASGNNANTFDYYAWLIGNCYTTVVGKFQNSDSPYGTFDQAGNVWEWNEAFFFYYSERSLRGGAFSYYDVNTRFDAGWGGDSALESNYIGFRVVQIPGGYQVPEPASLGVLGVAVVGLLVKRRGLRK